MVKEMKHYILQTDMYMKEKGNIIMYGKGIAYSKNRNKYGEWKDCKMHGKGILYFANGDVYEGEFKDGKRNGKGIAYSVNESIYNGEWKDGKKHGKGILYYANGDRYDGEWKDEKCMEDMEEKEKMGKKSLNKIFNKSCVTDVL